MTGKNISLDQKLLRILQLCNINFWEWDLKTKELVVINVSDKEMLAKISPVLAEDKAVIPNYPKVLIDKGIIRGNAVELLDEYVMMIYHAEDQKEVAFRIPFTCIDGETIWLQFKGIVYRDSEGNPDIASGYYTDITAILNASSSGDISKILEMENKNNQYLNVIKGITLEYANVFMINLVDGTYTPFRIDSITNKIMRRELEAQINFKEAIAFYIQEYVVEEDRESLQCLVNPAMIRGMLREKGYFNINYRSFRENEVVYCQAKVALGNVDDDEVVLAFRNIDEEVRSKQILEKESRQDALTGLLNRRAFQNDVRQEFYTQSGKNVAFIFIDLDHFKDINDTLGHSAGDRAIIDTALKLKKIFRKSDIISRYGGDEFCVFVQGIPKDILLQRLDTCLNDLKGTYEAEDKEVKMTASIGVAYYYNCSRAELEKMAEQADQALYKAKEAGRNRFILEEYKK